MSRVETWRKSIPGGGNSQCRDPEQKRACHVRGTLGGQCAGLGAWREMVTGLDPIRPCWSLEGVEVGSETFVGL